MTKAEQLAALEELYPTEKKDEIEEIKNDKAYIDNILVNAMYENNNLTVFKILFYLARIQSKTIKKGRYYHIEVIVKDLLDYTNIKTKQTIDRNLESMQKHTVSFKDEKGELQSRVQLITNIDYISSKKMIIDMHDTIYERIKHSGINHTVIDTINIMNVMKNKHSIRMIMLLQYILNFNIENKYKKYTLKQINNLFGTNYKEIYEIERKILKPIQKELNSNSNITFLYKKIEDMNYVGKGRKPIKEIKIIPKIKTYIETDIFSNLNYEQADTPADAQTKEQKEIQRLRKIEELEQQIDKELIFLKFGATSTEQKREIYLKIVEFINYVLDNNKDYKDLTESFFRYYKIAVKNGWSF